MSWYGKVTHDLSNLPGFIMHFEKELEDARKDVGIYGIVEKYFQKYLETYARALTSRDAEKYVDGEDEVIDFETLINEVALLRNKWLGILKGIDAKQWQLGHIVKLRTAGMEDVSL